LSIKYIINSNSFYNLNYYERNCRTSALKYVEVCKIMVYNLYIAFKHCGGKS
jgi:hypothetical protein